MYNYPNHVVVFHCVCPICACRCLFGGYSPEKADAAAVDNDWRVIAATKQEDQLICSNHKDVHGV